MVLSCDNALLVHTNIFDLKNLIVEVEIESAASNPQLDLSLFVYDVSKITHKLTSSQIKMIKCEILDPRIQLTDKEAQVFNSNVCKGTDPQDIGLLAEDASYGL